MTTATPESATEPTRLPESPDPTQDRDPTRADSEASHRRTPRIKPPRRLSPWVVVLMAVIAAGAFSFSADSWVKLAESAGFVATIARVSTVTVGLSWVLPVAVDAYTALTTWLYLGALPGSELRKYAGRSAFAAAGLSVIAQGAYHGLSAVGIVVGEFWPLVVVVGAIPPVLLGSVIHLLAIYLHDARPAPVEATRPAATTRPKATRVARPTPAAEPTRPVESTPETPPANEPSESRRGGSTRRLVLTDSATGDSEDSIRIDDETLRDVLLPYVTHRMRQREAFVQREMQRIVFNETGAKVGQRRALNMAKAIQAEQQARAS